MQYRTRIAPSPTGFMHVGTARTAYFNWLLAKGSNGQFIFRLDDTDTARNSKEADDALFEGFKWLGLEWNEFYRQSERTEIYLDWARRLLAAGYAFEADNGAIILNWHDFMPRSWRDEIAGEIPVTQTNIDQIHGKTVLLRGGDKLGEPTYQFASVVDDYTLGINYIVRGVDHVTNTAKQLAIWSAMQACDAAPVTFPKFAHIGLITVGGKKMSKRDGAASLLTYRDEGYHVDAVLNMMLRLGWGPNIARGDKEADKRFNLINREQAITLFDRGGKMYNKPAGYDAAKMKWYDKQYKAMDRRRAA